MSLSNSDSDSGISDSPEEPHNRFEYAVRPPLTPEEIGVIEGLNDVFRQIDSPICCFGHVPFETRDPQISYCTVAPLATEGSLDSELRAEG